MKQQQAHDAHVLPEVLAQALPSKKASQPATWRQPASNIETASQQDNKPASK
jgi:hypothetical protein